MKVITIYGNATKDAEVRTTQGGSDICSFTLAVNDRRDKTAYFFEVSYWGRAGVAVAPYITKGSSVVVSGEFSWREYNGNKYLQVNAHSVSLAGGKREDRGGGYDQSPAPSRANDFDDDIPF